MRHAKKHLIVDAMFKERNMFPYNIHKKYPKKYPTKAVIPGSISFPVL